MWLLQVLKLLVALIKPGERTSAKVLSVALHDIGEFVRFHPAGKTSVVKLGAKVPQAHKHTCT